MPALEKARLSGGTRKIQRTRVQTSDPLGEPIRSLQRAFYHDGADVPVEKVGTSRSAWRGPPKWLVLLWISFHVLQCVFVPFYIKQKRQKKTVALSVFKGNLSRLVFSLDALLLNL